MMLAHRFQAASATEYPARRRPSFVTAGSAKSMRRTLDAPILPGVQRADESPLSRTIDWLDAMQSPSLDSIVGNRRHALHLGIVEVVACLDRALARLRPSTYAEARRLQGLFRQIERSLPRRRPYRQSPPRNTLSRRLRRSATAASLRARGNRTLDRRPQTPAAPRGQFRARSCRPSPQSAEFVNPLHARYPSSLPMIFPPM